MPRGRVRADHAVDGLPGRRRRATVSRRRSRGCGAPPSSRSTTATTCLILSDRGVDAAHVAIPALLALSAVQQHLVREGTRMQAGLVVETADAREVHDVALLIGYGAAAVNPYLALDIVRELVDAGPRARPRRRRGRALRPRARGGPAQGDVQDGHLDGAELSRRADLRGGRARRRLVERHFTGTPSRIGGIGLAELGREALARHDRGFGRSGAGDRRRAAGRRPVPVAPPRRAAQVEPRDDRDAAGGRTAARSRAVRRVRAAVRRRGRRARSRCAACSRSSRPARRSARRGRARVARSSSGSSPARCRSARSAPRRTRRSRSR